MRTFTTTTIATFALVLGAAACGHDDMDMMSDHRAAFDEHLGTYEQDLRIHAADVLAMETLIEVEAEEDRHLGVAQRHMAAMNHEMVDMMGCQDDDGVGPHPGMMWAYLAEVADEIQLHRDAMSQLGSMGGAYEEERRHDEAMAALMLDMRHEMSAMMVLAGDLPCPHHM